MLLKTYRVSEPELQVCYLSQLSIGYDDAAFSFRIWSSNRCKSCNLKRVSKMYNIFLACGRIRKNVIILEQWDLKKKLPHVLINVLAFQMFLQWDISDAMSTTRKYTS